MELACLTQVMSPLRISARTDPRPGAAQDEAELRPVGSGRDEPNRDPEMPRFACDSTASAACFVKCFLQAGPSEMEPVPPHGHPGRYHGPAPLQQVQAIHVSVSSIRHSRCIFCSSACLRCLIICLSATFSILYFIGAAAPPAQRNRCVLHAQCRCRRAVKWRLNAMFLLTLLQARLSAATFWEQSLAKV